MSAGRATPRRPRRCPLGLATLRLTALLGAAALAGCAGLGPGSTASGSAAPAAAASAPASPAAITLAIEADQEAARSLLLQHLDLSRLQALRGEDAPDAAEWSRLMRAAPAQAQALLQTEGWFDAEVTVQRGEGSPLPVTVRVRHGERTRFAGLELTLDGPLQQAIADGQADALELQQQLLQAGRALEGQPFRNADWSDLKLRLPAQLRAAGYASVQLADSQATVNTAAHSAALRIGLHSGPLYLAGDTVVTGLQAHDAQNVRNLAGFNRGAPLTEARLLDYQDRLAKAGLFERATVSFEPNAAQAAATPLLVQLTELPLRQASVGLGYSDASGVRTSLEHTHRRPFGLAWTSYNKIELSQDNQYWTGDFYSHPQPGMYRNLLGVQLSRERSSSDVVLSQRLRWGRTQDDRRFERLYFLELLRSRQEDSLGVSAASALSANYHFGWRKLDNALLPTSGFALNLQGGAGQAFDANDGPAGPFARLYGRLTGYLPLGREWYGQARIEAGQIVKSRRVAVPDALGFRAGGDESVRGYGYRELAPTSDDGTVRSGIMLLTGSVEVAHPIVERLPSVWGALFVDAGRAVDDWRDYDPALGYGFGVRWRSPVGPLRIDWAWAEELRDWRWHMSVGITF